MYNLEHSYVDHSHSERQDLKLYLSIYLYIYMEVCLLEGSAKRLGTNTSENDRLLRGMEKWVKAMRTQEDVCARSIKSFYFMGDEG